MSTTFDFHADTGRAGPGLERRQALRIAAGIALSILLHGLLLALYRQPAASSAPAPAPPLTIRLRAAPPRAPAPVAEPEPAAAVAPSRPAAAPAGKAPRKKARERPAAVIAVDPAVRQSSEESHAVDAPPVEAQAPATTARRFDLDAARRTSRSVAGEADPARAGTALELLPPPALQTESRLERGIKSAKRRNCKDGVPGGLLAPLFLAMDKKDSGCKW